MSRKKSALALSAFAIVAIAALAFSGCAKKDSSAIKVGAIFSVTGPASFLGTPEKETAELFVKKLNEAGGIDGRKIELIVKDSGGKAENAVAFAKELIEKDGVVAIIGPSTSGESLAIKDLCNTEQVPLISCAAAEAIVEPVLPFVFKTPQKDSFVVKWAFQTMKEAGITTLAVVNSNSGFGKGGKGQLEKFAPEYGIQIVLAEEYDAASTDLSAVMTKVKASGAQALINWSVEPAQSIVAKNMRQIGLTIPLYQSHGFGNIQYVVAAGEAAEGIIFPCGRLLVADQLSDSDPSKKLLMEYKKDYEGTFGKEASTFGGHAYDAMVLLTAAIKKGKSADPVKIAAALASLKGVAGTAGVFNMSETDHNGLAMDSIVMQTVKNGKFALYP